MDPEIRKALDELRGLVGKNVDVAAKIEAIEAAARERTATLAELRKQIDDLVKHVEERKAEIERLQREARQRLELADPVRDAIHAARIFGMMVREGLMRHQNVECPRAFVGEAEELRRYREQRATLEAGAVTGSYLVPTITEAQLIDTLEEVSDLLYRADFIPGLPGNVLIPTLTGRPRLKPARASVSTAMTASDPTFGQLSLSPQEAYVYFGIDNRLLQMSAISLGTLAMNLLRDSMIDGISKWLIEADGTANYNSVTGILSEGTYVVNMASGHNSFGKLDNEDLNAALKGLLKRGRARASWVMSLYVQGILEDVSREGKVKIITEDQIAGGYRCKMRPIIIDESMPDEADDGAGKAILGVGDLATYVVGLVGGIQLAMSGEYLFGVNQTAFRGVVNMDIKRKPVATFLTVKTAA